MQTGIESHIRDSCRLCGNGLALAYKLVSTPHANSFPEKPDSDAERFPLEMMQCYMCGHVQLHHVLEGIYKDYKYQTPVTQSRAAQDYAAKLRGKYPKAKQACEIGANNGLLTWALRDQGFMTVGVDPTPHDGSIYPGYFDYDFVWHQKKRFGTFDLVVANNVFAHINDLDSVIGAVDFILSDDGALVFEVQYLVDLLDKGMFDMVYHEHCDYHHLDPLLGFFKERGMVVTEWEHIPAHGGSIRVTVKRRGEWAKCPTEVLQWDAFHKRVEDSREKVLNGLKGNVVAFGATAKACTMIHHFGLADKISYCVDETPTKIGRYIPGTDIQIFHPDEMRSSPPDTLFLTAWNYEDVIRARYPKQNILTPF